MDRKTMKVPQETHKELKIQSAKKGMSMIDYLEYLLIKEKKEIENE